MTKILYIPNGEYVKFYVDYRIKHTAKNNLTIVYEESTVYNSSAIRTALQIDESTIHRQVQAYLEWFLKKSNDELLKLEQNIPLSSLSKEEFEIIYD